MCDNMKGNHMKCMSIALNNEWNNTNDEVKRTANLAYNMKETVSDPDAVKAYEVAMSKQKEVEELMRKHDKGLAEYYRKRELKSKLGVK